MKSLRHKFIRTLLLVAGIIGVSTLAIVGFLSAQASAVHLRAVQQYIEEGIASKGKVLAQNHALALRGLTLDNAFLDMQRLLERAITDDGDLVYGVYVSAEHETLALARRPLKEADTTPEREAWRTLGLGEGEIAVKNLRVEHTRRFGEELLEVAAPVAGEDGEVLGTVRYGLSTKRMRDALGAARAESDARLRRTFVSIGLLVSLAMLGGVLLSRREAVRITRPIGDLTRAAELLAAGNHDARVNIQSKDELELLGASFNRMARDLGASYRNLEEMNRTLEQKVAVRTSELADKNRDMRLVLDNVDQGFVTLSPDGTMALERSRQVGAWFGEGNGATHFWEYLAHTSESFAAAFELAWSQIADDFLPLEVCLAQLPERLTSDGRTWSLRYTPYFRDDRLEGVLVAIGDITERLLREREDAEHAELMQAFKRVVQDRAGFETFLGEASSILAQISNRELDHDTVLLKRALHTLKGTSGSMGLTTIAQLCHALESELAEDGALSNERVAELRERFRVLTEQLAKAGMHSQRLVEIPEKDYAELLRLAADNATPRREVVHRLTDFMAEPAERGFRRLGDQAVLLARRFGKGELQVVIEADGVRLDRTRFAPLFAELVHVVRNAVDHGIEAPAERLRRGKPAAGKLVLRATVNDGELSIEIADDGAGIDWESVRRAAAARGLPHRTEAELVEALCQDGVTTCKEVTALSGRGVGMAAVKQRVHAMHGVLEVESARGRGTTWIARVPHQGGSQTSGVFSARTARALRAAGPSERR